MTTRPQYLLVVITLGLLACDPSSKKSSKMTQTLSSNVTAKTFFDKEMPFEILSAMRGITKQSSAPDSSMCRGWNIFPGDLPTIIRDCKVTDRHEWHHLFDVLPCLINGQLEQNGHTYKFEINAGSWMTIYNEDSLLLLGNFEKQNEKYFISNAWNEDDK